MVSCKKSNSENYKKKSQNNFRKWILAGILTLTNCIKIELVIKAFCKISAKQQNFKKNLTENYLNFGCRCFDRSSLRQ